MAGCSDDTIQGNDGGIPSDAKAVDGPPKKDSHKPKVDKGFPKDKNQTSDKAKPTDKGAAKDKGQGPDGPVVTKLPPPPKGAVQIQISVDDSKDKAYAASELQLKGALSYNEQTHVITLDSKWTGPWVTLYDDGAAGLEGPGTKAGDHKHGTVVYVLPTGSHTLDYGFLSPAGWMWPQTSGNLKLSFKNGDPKKTVGFTIPSRAGVAPTWVVDAKKLSGVSPKAGYQALVVRSNVTHWSPLPCRDDGKNGDAAKGDSKYTCSLLAHLGQGKLFPHLGLAQPGSQVRFYLDIGGNGYHKTSGISVSLLSGSGTTSASVGMSGYDMAFTVPPYLQAMAAPAPDNSPLTKSGHLPGGKFSLPATLGIKGYYYLPGSYDAHRPTPLLVALHGAYEDGQWMINVWQTLAEDLGYILMTPSSAGKSWDLTSVFKGLVPVEEKPLLAAVAWLRGRHNIKAQQIGVEGFSDGASMSLYMGTTHGQTFCAMMANSPGGMGKNYGKTPKPAAYITHGDADKVLPVANARWIKNTLISNGYKVDYFEFKGGGHSFPTDHKIPMLDWFDSMCK